MDRLTTMATFTTVVQSGSFAGAAQRLNMSPALVTRRVRELEDRLGARLLNRTTRKLSLTEAGRAYFEKVAPILAEIEAVDSSIIELQSTPRGALRVSATSALSKILVPLFNSFGAAFPQITLELVAVDRLTDLVEKGIDIAVGSSFEPLPDVVLRKLGSFRLICCAAPAYLARHGTPRQLTELARHNCIAYAYPGFMHLSSEWRFSGPDGEVTVPVSGNLRTNDSELIRAAALDGRGVIIAPDCLAEEDIGAGRLLQLFPAHHAGDIPMVALFPNREHLPLKTRSFIDFAVKHFAEHPAFRQAPRAA